MVLLFFMDGVKYDMMKKHMPFLASLQSRPLISEFGYSCACHATMYTSRYIDEHKTWFIWKKGNNSPYKWINYVPGLKYINLLPLKLLVGKTTRRFSRNTSYSGVPCLVNLPLKYWPLFELCDDVMWNDPCWKPELPNLFTIMEREKIPYHVVALHRNTRSDDVFREESSVDYKKNEFVYFFIGYTDNIMHSHGEHGEASQKYLHEIDSFIKRTYEKSKIYNDDVSIIAYSDHGHIDLKQPYIDINDYFKAHKTNVNKFIHLIESNYARFWFRNEDEQKIVRAIIEQMQEEKLGFIIDQEYKDRYHLNLPKEEHGELVFYLSPPSEFTKTIWGFGHTVKSGHGFEPTIPKHYGIFCSNKPIAQDRNFASLVDVLPSVMAQMNISCSNYTFRGQNIIGVINAE